MTSVSTEPSLYYQMNGDMHHLSSLIASGGGHQVPIVRVDELPNNDTLSTERRHELAEQVSKKFALVWNPHPYTVVYIEQLEVFIGIDLRELCYN